MTKKIGPYDFPTPKPLDEARPPKGEAGVYVFLTRNENGSERVRYIGSTGDLQSRVNFGHKHAKQLFSEVGRALDKLLVTWKVIGDRQQMLSTERLLIARFGGRVENTEKKPK